MSTFQQLAYEAQVMHLTAFAHNALKTWGIAPQALELVVYANNAVFRVADGVQTYGLRVYRPGKRSLAEIAGEWLWVHALHTALPGHVPAQQADIYSGRLDGIDGTVYAALWRWLDGEVAAPDAYTRDHAAAVGVFAAHMHTVALEIRGSEYERQITRPRLDHEGLFGANSPYASGGERDLISDKAQATLDAVAEQVREVMAALEGEPNAFGMIHGDFIFKNTLFNRSGAVAALDFDDCGFGYFLYDMACPLLFYKPLPTYPDLKAALWDGYTSVRPLPDGYRAALETMVAGRYVASCRWVAGNAQHPSLRGNAREIIDGRAAELRGYLDTGVL